MADEQRGGHLDGALVEDVLGIMPSLYASADLDDTFGRIAQAAVDVLDACDYASVTVTTGRELATRAFTDPVARTADEFQYDESEGPCLDAVTREQWVMTPDVQSDQRWPRFSARLHGELDVHSMLSVRLGMAASPARNLGGLNMYSRRTPSPATSAILGCFLPRSPRWPLTPPGRRPRWWPRSRPGR